MSVRIGVVFSDERSPRHLLQRTEQEVMLEDVYKMDGRKGSSRA